MYTDGNCMHLCKHLFIFGLATKTEDIQLYKYVYIQAGLTLNISVKLILKYYRFQPHTFPHILHGIMIRMRTQRTLPFPYPYQMHIP